MTYVGLALFAEGESDHAFLGPLLRRATLDVCARELGCPVETSEVLPLHSPGGKTDTPRDTRILTAAREALGAWHLLFIHTDAGGDPSRARALRDPLLPPEVLLRQDRVWSHQLAQPK